MIYFIRSGLDGPIKIGYSRDEESLKERIASLQTAHPEPIYTLHTMAGDQSLEAEIHRELAGSRKRGEWFDPTDEVKELVNRAKSGDGPLSRAGGPNWLALARVNWVGYLRDQFGIRACEFTGELNERHRQHFIERGGNPDDIPPFPETAEHERQWLEYGRQQNAKRQRIE